MGAPLRLRLFAAGYFSSAPRGVPHAPQNRSPSGFSTPQLEHRIRPLYSFGCSRARKPPAPSPSGGNLLRRDRSPLHPIDIRRPGIHGRQQLCSLKSAEHNLHSLQHLSEQRRGVLNLLETLGGRGGVGAEEGDLPSYPLEPPATTLKPVVHHLVARRSLEFAGHFR